MLKCRRLAIGEGNACDQLSLADRQRIVRCSSIDCVLLIRQELTTIHNDAFLPIIGQKRPAIGRSFVELWSEAWAEIGPIAAKAYAGTSTFIENYPLRINRNGSDELSHFTFLYIPVRDDAGTHAGMLITVSETTEVVDRKTDMW